MDDTLLQKIRDVSGNLGEGREVSIHMTVVDDASGEIQIIHGERRESYNLKPLGELYGSGNPGTVDPESETYMPLFLCIEEEIAKFDADEQRLNDAAVTLALGRLSMSPDGQTDDSLTRRIQMGLRINLSLHNFSRQEVRQVIRKIGKSVDRHLESGQRRGYLDFLRGNFAPKRK